MLKLPWLNDYNHMMLFENGTFFFFFFFMCQTQVLYLYLLLLYRVQFETGPLNEKTRAVELLNIFWL